MFETEKVYTIVKSRCFIRLECQVCGKSHNVQTPAVRRFGCPHCRAAKRRI